MFDSNQLKLVILPGKPAADFGALDLYNKAYDHFKAIWQRTIKLRTGAEAYDPYCFFRQDASITIFHGDEPAAQCLSSLLHVDAHITHDLSYFKHFKGAPEEYLREKRVQAFSTIEFSSVGREYSERKIGGLCLNEMINQFGSKFGYYRGAGAVAGLPRRVTGTNAKAERLGYRKLAEGLERHGLCVDVMIALEEDIQPHENPGVQLLIDRLWNERLDLSRTDVLPDFRNRKPKSNTEKPGVFQ